MACSFLTTPPEPTPNSKAHTHVLKQHGVRDTVGRVR